MEGFIKLRGVRTNNLKNIDLSIPLNTFTIVTGVSGSGKSSLVFDTLYAEGQRRYVESLSTYTRQFLEKMAKPDLESLENICPSIALEQKNQIHNSRTTVATMSELYDYLRLLFAKIGRTFCIECGKTVKKDSPASVATLLNSEKEKTRFYVLGFLDEAFLKKENWEIARKTLLSSGFERLLIQGETHDILSAADVLFKNKKRKPGEVFLIIDRMSMPENPASDPRLLDALEQAFEQGKGQIALGMVNAETQKVEYRFYSNRFRCDDCEIDYKTPEPQYFSFNSPLGACPECSGFGFNLELEEDLVVPDKRKTIRNGAIDPFTKPAYTDWHEELLKFCERHKIATGKKYEDLSIAEKKLLWDGDGAKKGFRGIRGCFEILKGWKYKLYVRVFIRRYQSQKLCLSCNGARLKKEALAVKIGGQNIAELLALSIEKAVEFFKSLKLNKTEEDTGSDLLMQLAGRLKFLFDVGVGYLTLNRLGKTLSGGECQRIYLATQLGNKLSSTLYVLDEPSIGLHPHDTAKLIELLKRLRDQGNTVVVVEHDLDVIRAADYMVELGPHAGFRGGEIVAHGPLKKVLQDKGCLTSKYLTNTFSIPKKDFTRKPINKSIKILGACENNLKNLDVEFPLHQLIAVTGLSGSGKTTLIHHTLHNALARLLRRENLDVGRFQRIYGVENITDVVLLDQSPIGRSARSNPATYLKIWDDVRKIYANQSLSLRRGYEPKHFSFNVDAGRCPVCKGEGEVTLDMHFMADLKLPCEECEGKKFKKAVLEVEYKKKNIHQLLLTTIDECLEIFREYPSIVTKLQILRNVGLGYLQLGQSSSTLSGGESQRLKIASVLQERSSANVLYIFDEPTTGLHIDDVKKLIKVLHDLVDQKNTVIVVEHNLDLIAQADHIIDLGPGGGTHGGEIVVEGSVENLIEEPRSLTGQHLKTHQAN